MFGRLIGRLRVAPGLASICLAVAAVLSPFASAALAASSLYGTGNVGYDVSYPNCSQSIGTVASNGHPYSLAVVGVTGGRAFSSNPCFSQELKAAKGVTASPSLYMNLNAPIGSTASEATKGPLSCARSNKACLSYNYGYQAALSAQSNAKDAGAVSTWWLDVETGNSWSSNQAANFEVIHGAEDALTANGVTNVGVYSTPSMWKKITGAAGAASGLPVWTAPGTTSLSDAATYCSKPSASFTGGPVWLVQYSGGAYDEDYAC